MLGFGLLKIFKVINMGEEDGQNSKHMDERVSPEVAVMDKENCVSNTESGDTKSEIPKTIDLTAKDLAHDIVFYFAGHKQGKAPSNHASTLRRTAVQMSQKHDILYRGMMSKLEITKENAVTIFKNVADEIFRDNQYNWGRIVSVYTFGARIGKHLYETDKASVYKFADVLGLYVSTRLGPWIHKQGGWDAFDNYFPAKNNLEESLWKGLWVAALGLGALATVVATVR